MNLWFVPSLASDNPVDHVTDKVIFGHEGAWYISNVSVMLLLGGIVTAAAVIPASKRIVTRKSAGLEGYRAQGLWANLVESICLYLRDEVFRPVLGGQTDQFTPLLWSLFWFIVVCNLLGLVPILDATAMFGLNHGHGIGGTATQSIWVTGALAGVAFLYWNGVALARDPVGWLKHMTGGAPIYMWPIMIPVELMGMFVKPFALALRLFANMTGGHIIIAVLLSFVKSLIQALGGPGFALALLPLLGAVAINLLEIMVAFIQAYIFTFLTCLFLGQLVVHEHDEHEEHHLEHHDQHLPEGAAHH